MSDLPPLVTVPRPRPRNRGRGCGCGRYSSCSSSSVLLSHLAVVGARSEKGGEEVVIAVSAPRCCSDHCLKGRYDMIYSNNVQCTNVIKKLLVVIAGQQLLSKMAPKVMPRFQISGSRLRKNKTR